MSNFPLEEVYLLRRYNSFLLRDWLRCWYLHNLWAYHTPVHTLCELRRISQGFVAGVLFTSGGVRASVCITRAPVCPRWRCLPYVNSDEMLPTHCALSGPWCIFASRRGAVEQSWNSKKRKKAPSEKGKRRAIVISHQQQQMAPQSAVLLWKFPSESPQPFLQLTRSVPGLWGGRMLFQTLHVMQQKTCYWLQLLDPLW